MPISVLLRYPFCTLLSRKAPSFLHPSAQMEQGAMYTAVVSCRALSYVWPAGAVSCLPSPDLMDSEVTLRKSMTEGERGREGTM